MELVSQPFEILREKSRFRLKRTLRTYIHGKALFFSVRQRVTIRDIDVFDTAPPIDFEVKSMVESRRIVECDWKREIENWLGGLWRSLFAVKKVVTLIQWGLRWLFHWPHLRVGSLLPFTFSHRSAFRRMWTFCDKKYFSPLTSYRWLLMQSEVLLCLATVLEFIYNEKCKTWMWEIKYRR